MRILTIKQPWAHAVIFDGKDVENRGWGTLYRGPIAIHAGQAYDDDGRERATTAPPATLIDRGVILGVVDLVDVVRDSPSSWAVPGVDMFHWVFANPRAIRPIPYRGTLGLTRIDDALRVTIEHELDILRLAVAAGVNDADINNFLGNVDKLSGTEYVGATPRDFTVPRGQGDD